MNHAWRNSVVTSVTALMFTMLFAVPAHARYEVNPGFTFSNPANQTSHNTFSLIHQAIAHTERGSRVQVATYILNSEKSFRLLKSAFSRRVVVQVMVDQRSSQADRLRTLLNRNGRDRSFFKYCGHERCGLGSNMHLKLYVFSEVGGRKRVVMSGSTNLHKIVPFTYYTDMYTSVNNRAYYRQATAEIERLRLNKRPVFTAVDTRELSSWFTPTFSRQRDPLLKLTRNASCAGRPYTYALMFKWSSDWRGDAFRNAFKRLDQRGCKVRVIGGKITRAVERSLERIGIPVLNNKFESPNRIAHTKMVILGGNRPMVCSGTAHFNSNVITRGKEHTFCVNSRNWQTRASAWAGGIWRSSRH